MSLNPVYLWNPQNFPDPQAMLPDFKAAYADIEPQIAEQLKSRAVLELPQGADTSAFDKLAEYIAEAARADETSAAFKGYL